MKEKLLPSERWNALKQHIIKEIEKIDKDTTWQPYEPKWWLEMMDISEKLLKLENIWRNKK
jgi:hypothetical protein